MSENLEARITALEAALKRNGIVLKGAEVEISAPAAGCTFIPAQNAYHVAVRAHCPHCDLDVRHHVQVQAQDQDGLYRNFMCPTKDCGAQLAGRFWRHQPKGENLG